MSSSFLLGVDPSGKSAYDSEAFPPGANIEATAKAVTCYCGNAVGQGGYIDLSTPKVSVPPWIQPPFSPPTVGTVTVTAIVSPRGVKATKKFPVADPGRR